MRRRVMRSRSSALCEGRIGNIEFSDWCLVWVAFVNGWMVRMGWLAYLIARTWA